MHKKRISQVAVERCLLTDVAPYETPLLFSNWGAYNYTRLSKRRKMPTLLQRLFNGKEGNAIPMKYRIKKDGHSHRTLYVIHPKCSEAIVSLYRKYDYQMVKLCRRSSISLRYPVRVAKFFLVGKGRITPDKAIEEVTSNSAYASSYFAYRQYSHLHKFFDSENYADLEKQFSYTLHVDITKCFPSIYTHSISWAVRGKALAKARAPRGRSQVKSFDEEFDFLMRILNYGETNGIAVGPELSRIFAEIILQKVDATVMDHLADNNMRDGVDYRWFRYIDDYFIFFNDPRKEELLLKQLRHELEKFNMFLGADKLIRIDRPFITATSIAKIETKDFFIDLGNRLPTLRADDGLREINRIRAIVKKSGVSVGRISSMSLSRLQRMVWRLNRDEKNYSCQVYILLELASHLLRMDMRVPCCFKWIGIADTVKKRLSWLSAPKRHEINDKLLRELRAALNDAFDQGATIEGGNLLIAAASLYGDQAITKELLIKVILKCREAHDNEYSRSKRLSYFDIVCLLYAIGDRKVLWELRNEVLAEANEIITRHPFDSHSETAHLLLDLMACPSITQFQKKILLSHGCAACGIVATEVELDEFVEYSSRQVWFFSWDQGDRLSLHLKKKRLLLSY